MTRLASLFTGTVRRRLLFSFGAILLLFLIYAVLSQFVLRDVLDDSEQINPLIGEVGTDRGFVLGLAQLEADLNQYVLTGGAEYRTAIIADMDLLGQTLESIRRSEVALEPGNPELARLEAAYADLDAQVQELVKTDFFTVDSSVQNRLILAFFDRLDEANAAAQDGFDETLDDLSQTGEHQRSIIDTLVSRQAWLGAAIFALTIFMLYYVSRSLAGPVSKTAAAADQIARGELGVRVDVGKRQDEIGKLATSFNSMADQLQGMVGSLEERVQARTRDLFLTLEVGQISTRLYQREDFLQRVVEFIHESFGLYYAQVYLLDDARRYAVLRAGTTDVGQKLIAAGHRLSLKETSIVARSVQSRTAVLVEDTRKSDVHKPNPLLPDTRSEVAIPLVVADQILGVLDLQARDAGTFTSENLPVFEAMASQLAAALQNVQSFSEARAAIERADLINRRLTGEAWGGYLGQLSGGKRVGYAYDLQSVQPLSADTKVATDGRHNISRAVSVRGQSIGAITVADESDRSWSEEEIRLVEDVAERVALAVEQYRSADETARLATEMRTVAQVSTEIAGTLDLDELLISVATLTRDRFGLYHAHVYLLDDEGQSLVLAAGAGDVGRLMVQSHHSIPLVAERSLVARAARSHEVVIENDVRRAVDFLPNPLLPFTRAEMAVPMLSGEHVVGVLDVQSRTVNSFAESDRQIFATLASQIAVAVQNARLFTESQQRLAIIDNAPFMVTLSTFEGRTLYTNQAAVKMLGFESPDEITDTTITGHIPAEEYARLENEIIPVVMEQGIWQGESVLTRRNGVVFPVYLTMVVIRGDERHPSIMAIIAEDITERKNAERELFERQALLNLIINTSPDWIFAKDTDYRYMLVNRAFAEFYGGLDPDQMVGKNDYDLGTPVEFIEGDPEKGIVGFRVDDRRVIEEGEALHNPNDVVQHTDGTVHNYDTNKLPLRDASGEIIGVLGVSRDMTEQQNLLRETQARVRDLQALNRVTDRVRTVKNLSSMLEAVMRVAMEAFGADNAAVLRLHRHDHHWRGVVATGEGLSNENIRELVAQEDAFAYGVAAVRSQDVVPVDDTSQNAEATPHVLGDETAKSVLAMPIIYESDSTGVMFLQYLDYPHTFTQEEIALARGLADQIALGVSQHLNEQQIERRAAEMQTVAEVGTEAATTLDVNELLKSVADLAKERFSLYHAHIYLLDDEGDNLLLAAGSGEIGDTMVAAGHRIPASRESSLVAQSARGRKAVLVNDVTISPDFLPNPLLPLTRSEMAVPMIAGEQVVGVLDVQSNQIDYFDQQSAQVYSTLASQVAVAVQNARLYNEQVDAAEQLREVDRLKSQFLASMSHELRTPLNSIIGYAEVLLDGIDGELNEDMHEDIGAIHGSGKHLLSLINDVLDLAKIEAGQMDLISEGFALRPVVEDMVSTNRVLVKDKLIQLIVNIPEDLPMVRGDQLRVRQVINNLLSNAVKFTEEGDITISAKVYEREPNMVVVSIRDSGIGMTPDQLRVIFDRFRQVDQSHTRRAGGTGLGLSITRELVEMHGGAIWVESQYGSGSVFHFTLPMASPVPVSN